MRPDSLSVHAGRELRSRDPLAPAIYQTAVYVYEDLDEYEAVASGQVPGHLYGRNSNENVAMLESAVAALEGAEMGVATASGMAAIHISILALAPSPRPILVPPDLYGVTLSLLRLDLAPLGYELRPVDLFDLEGVRHQLRGAGLLVCETISNPLCRVADLEAICRLAREAAVPVLVDNTFATPVLCRPLELGATASVHSVTKYLGGHSDLVAGAVVGSRALMSDIRSRVVRMGSSLGPFEAWLAVRGLRTLALRMRRHSDNALSLAHGLAGLSRVERVHYPLLDGSPDAAVASRLLSSGAGGMLALDLEGGQPAVQGLLDRFQMVSFAASLGGVETTISYPDIASHRALSPEERLALGITPGTVRVSTGIEDPEDILEDFRQAVG